MNKYGGTFGFDTKEKIQFFLSQAYVESGGFSSLFRQEKTNYTAQNLATIWPNRFSFTDPAKENPNNWVGDPQRILNFVYGRRNGNGDATTGDGYKYRGRGIIMLTGRYNYQKFKDFYNANFQPSIDPVSNPDLLLTDPNVAVISAMWFFKTNVLDRIDVTAATPVDKVSRRVNGGTHGLAQRRTQFLAAKANINCY
ncbi:glycoside hydrolase family 19 protein [Asinibacterium sp. OR53]|uniref:glycoside hydrolase family 19 protein n=1 Tax=Asinibacterium sp. OR53 TaxID=925409 RepID=UPI0006885089|nr:glycoside hydrolase family 19 protein [Asinibacterium sp. OR53]